MTFKPQTPRIARDERGQAMVEFAFVVPILLVVVLAVIQFGITYNNYVTLTDAARAGARKAAVSRYLGSGSGQGWPPPSTGTTSLPAEPIRLGRSAETA